MLDATAHFDALRDRLPGDAEMSGYRAEALAYGAIIGGAIGDIIDRIRFRGVTDFLDFYVGSQHWPAFNMADVFVVCGVVLLIAAPRLSQNAHA